MRRAGGWAVLLTWWLAFPAQAQVEEVAPAPSAMPAEVPPPAAPAPPATVRVRYSRYRTSWYIGFGFGGGGGWLRADDGDESRGGLAFSVLRVGWVARPWLLLGFEGSTWFLLEAPVFESRWLQFLHYDAVVTLFPSFDRGFYVKGGAGLGVTLAERMALGVSVQEQRRETGADLKLGLGHEWQLLASLNLGAELCYGLMLLSGGQAHDLTAQLTFTWY